MINFRKIKLNNSMKNLRFLSGPKRKYPIDPESSKYLPVFEFGVSKKSYKRVFIWGNAETGALGLKGLVDKRVECLRHPKRHIFAEFNEIETAAAGFGFTVFAVKSDTDIKLFGSGLNTDSQIGYREVRPGHPLGLIYYPQPISLPFRNPKKSKITKLAAGRAHLLVLSDEEGVFLLGNNTYGQCGRKIIPDENYSKSNLINHIADIEGKKIIDVECGQDHSMILAEDGSVYSCGWGADGQTGLGSFKNTGEFQQIKGDIENERIIKLACRSDFVLALNDKGETFGWGNTEYGQLTLPTGEQQLANPIFADKINKLGKIKSIATGGSFCLAANEHGEVFSWGYGLLGLGPTVQLSKIPRNIPVTLFGRNDFQPNSTVVKVACGLNYSAAITNFGDLYTWGRNKTGCLGLGHLKDQYFPLKVSLTGSVEDVVCALDHTIAICKPFI